VAGVATCSTLGRTVHAECRDHTLRGAAAIVIRPERIAVADAGDPVPAGHNCLPGTVTDVVYLGAASQVRIEVAPGATLVAQVANHAGPRSVSARPGSRVTCTFAPDAVQVLRQSAVEVPDELAIQLA
jgi:spermidine/putrescine transport system ATP-binding protein